MFSKENLMENTSVQSIEEYEAAVAYLEDNDLTTPDYELQDSDLINLAAVRQCTTNSTHTTCS
jgi:hypothetical protein